jgi:hypothetical protein
MRVSFGLINQEVQESATVTMNIAIGSLWKPKKIFDERTLDDDYGSLERDFYRVDGTMYNPPNTYNSIVYDTGLISSQLVTKAGITVLFTFNETDGIKGLSIDFGENYPVSFDIVTPSEGVLEVRGNDTGEWYTEEVFSNLSEMKLIVYEMKTPETRLRIRSVKFGYGLLYTNENIVDSTLDSYSSPITESLPQTDFKLQIYNASGYFNIDNPKSAVHFLETGQPLDIYYGYDTPNAEVTEWFKSERLYCSSWSLEEDTLTLNATDIYRTLDGEYAQCDLVTTDRRLYDVVDDIFKDASIGEYTIDGGLKNYPMKAPITPTTHKEALQMAANASHCALTQDENGNPRMLRRDLWEHVVTSTGDAWKATSTGFLTESTEIRPTMFTQDYIRVDGSHTNFADDGSFKGWASSQISDANGLFDVNPKLTFTAGSSDTYTNTFTHIDLLFGGCYPLKFMLRAYQKDKLVYDETFEGENITPHMKIYHNFQTLTKWEIEFIKTQKPYHRIVVNKFEESQVEDFKLEKMDITSTIQTTKDEKVKELKLYYHQWNRRTSPEDTLVSETLTVTKGSTIAYRFDDCVHSRRITLNDVEYASSHSGIIAYWHDPYYTYITFNQAGTYELKIYGVKQVDEETTHSIPINANGKILEWNNPLMAKNLNCYEELKEYYSQSIEYEFDTRGNPEIEVGDLVYQENDYQDDMVVRVVRRMIGFNGSYYGSMTTRRV